MNEEKYFTQKEVAEFIYRVGDIIMDINLSDKQLPNEYTTAMLLMRTAHSMFADNMPEENEDD